jgi:transcriptional regulator with XRE-family HTH domain
MALAAMPFPERLSALRKERHLTQQALADRAGLHVSQIRKYETDVTQPSIEAIKKLAVALSVPSDLLLFDQDERGPDDVSGSTSRPSPASIPTSVSCSSASSNQSSSPTTSSASGWPSRRWLAPPEPTSRR